MTGWRTALRLGRVSNLPTVWTNALAAAVLAAAAGGGAAPSGFAAEALIAMLALSLFYVGGMWLNDAFDADVDARERPGRPIPSGAVPRRTVSVGGGLFLLGGVLLTGALGGAAFAAGLALAAAIVLYDWLHKRTVLAPLIMGLTRFLCYSVAACAVARFAGDAVLGAIGLGAWVVGLTYAARQEAYDRLERAWPLGVLAVPLAGAGAAAAGSWLASVLWLALAAWTAYALHLLFRRAPGDVPRAVVALIAGIALYDATLIASAGAPWLALLAVGGFGATLLLQRLVPGT